MNRFPAKVVLSVFLVFVSGVLLGALGYRYYMLKEVSAGGPPRRSMEDMRKMYLEEMRQRLKLNPQQYEDMKVIVDETGAKFRILREKSRPEMQAIQEEQVSRINDILSPEQQKAYEQLRKERDEQKRRRDRDR